MPARGAGPGAESSRRRGQPPTPRDGRRRSVPGHPPRRAARSPGEGHVRVRARAPTSELAQHARAILKTYCYRCHGVRFEVPGYDVLDRDVLVARRGEDEPTYVVPGQPEASYLWERVGVDRDMPPSGPKPPEAERAVIARWIEAGAPFPQVAPAVRPRWTEREVLAAIRDHLRQAHPGDRPYLRYFTFHNLYDNPRVDDADLRLARAAVAKLVNSLVLEAGDRRPAGDRSRSGRAGDRPPRRGLGRARPLVRDPDPISLRPEARPGSRRRRFAHWPRRWTDQTGTALPFVRADWFIATASRPPLYTILLDLPRDDRALERQLKVDVAADFLNDKLARAGFAGSGVSSQNRLVERHPALYGAYWKSYDFSKNDGTANLFRYPLGPGLRGQSLRATRPSSTPGARSSSTCLTACRRTCSSMPPAGGSTRGRSRSSAMP